MAQRRKEAAKRLDSIVREIEAGGLGDELRQFFRENQGLTGAMGNQVFGINNTNNSGNTYVGGTTNFQAALLEAGDSPLIIPGTGPG